VAETVADLIAALHGACPLHDQKYPDQTCDAPGGAHLASRVEEAVREMRRKEK